MPEPEPRPPFSLILQNVRCFRQCQKGPIRPLTLLVGENSSGKSTFLAMLSFVLGEYAFPWRPRFNDPPYALGTFENIASRTTKPDGEQPKFSIGYSLGTGEVVATYEPLEANPRCILVRAKSANAQLELRPNDRGIAGSFKTDKGFHDLRLRGDSTLEFPRIRGAIEMMEFLGEYSLPSRERRALARARRSLEHVVTPPFKSAVSIGPLRGQPQRTYEPIDAGYSPDGRHVPLQFREVEQGRDLELRNRLRKALRQFGTDSGLFNNVKVEILGRNAGSPFRILVEQHRAHHNLIDVGYGVCQVLPLIVQAEVFAAEHPLLVQQPEVHLHPRAQAALGTYLAKVVGNRRRTIVVETHSDYLIDRVRREVAQGTISATDVAILYFDRRPEGTCIHPISVDNQGNVLEAPRSYRKFFLDEMMKTLERTDPSCR